MEGCDARAKYRSGCFDVDRIRKMYAILVVDYCVFGEESVGCESLKTLFARGTVEIVDLASAIDVER